MMTERPIVTVGGLIVAPDGQVLLVRSHKWSDLYAVPGGKVELGETLETAYRREVFEETQLKITNLRFALVQDSIFSPEFWQKRHFVMHDYIADLDPSCRKEEVQLNDEAQLYCWVSPQQALALPMHRECRTLLEWYLTHILQPPPKLGTIGFRQLRIACIVGIYPEEREREQDLFIDLKIKVDFSLCVASQRVQDSVDYVALSAMCERLAKQNRYQLLESLASDILEQCIQQFGAVKAWVSIQKPAAIPSAACALVEMERCKGETTCGS